LYSNNFWPRTGVHDLLTIAYLLTGVPAVTIAITSDSATVEALRPTAAIIKFPVRPKPAAPRPEDRLSKALVSLNAAMVEQRRVLAAWRGALGELKATTVGLDESLQRYQTSLRSLGGSVSALRTKARALEQLADGVPSATD
jgi:hypothetical protein